MDRTEKTAAKKPSATIFYLNTNVPTPLLDMNDQESFVEVLDIFRLMATCSESDLNQLVERFAPKIDQDWFDPAWFRLFCIDVANYLETEEEKIISHLDREIEDKKQWCAEGNLFFEYMSPSDSDIFESMTKSAMQNIANGTANSLEYAAALFWLGRDRIKPDGTMRSVVENPSLAAIVAGAVCANCDSIARLEHEMEETIALLPAWWTKRTIEDNWFFAVIMQDGTVIPFSHLFDFSIETDWTLYANIETSSRLYDLHSYKTKVFSGKEMRIKVSDIAEVQAADGTIWWDAVMAEISAYEPYRRNVSINAKHVKGRKSNPDGTETMTFVIPMLRDADLCEGVMQQVPTSEMVVVFETADT
ncbi:hypothetical protein AB4090_08350 [Acidithiobacillus sp. IBUN Pt1247-S3]|uniref:hypothetical protein n=1 Tax=Acidithiobacillus sp. IBUN Pt1247-S3 TaxID=3166642 RepID=UPI0034E5B498